MRRIITLCALLFSCGSLWAADAVDRWRISILASEISHGRNQPWSEDPHAGISVGIAYLPAPQWDVELTAGSQSHISPYTRFVVIPIAGGPIAPFTEFRRYRVRPVDLAVTRHFLAGQAVMPYVRAGLRYVDAPSDPQAITTIGVLPVEGPAFPVNVAEGFGFRDRVSAQAGAGVRVRLTERTALRAEADRLLRSEGTDFDPLTRYAVGVSWKF
jgi:outer membrane protein with beta-barrel domain